MIYSNFYWEANQFDLAKLQNYRIWYADYCVIPQSPYNFEYLQYSSTGRVPGIRGKVDLDVRFVPDSTIIGSSASYTVDAANHIFHRTNCQYVPAPDHVNIQLTAKSRNEHLLQKAMFPARSAIHESFLFQTEAL